MLVEVSRCLQNYLSLTLKNVIYLQCHHELTLHTLAHLIGHCIVNWIKYRTESKNAFYVWFGLPCKYHLKHINCNQLDGIRTAIATHSAGSFPAGSFPAGSFPAGSFPGVPASSVFAFSSFFSLGRPPFILRGLEGAPPFPGWLPPVVMKWAKSSVCLSKNPNLLDLSDSWNESNLKI